MQWRSVDLVLAYGPLFRSRWAIIKAYITIVVFHIRGRISIRPHRMTRYRHYIIKQIALRALTVVDSGAGTGGRSVGMINRGIPTCGNSIADKAGVRYWSNA